MTEEGGVGREGGLRRREEKEEEEEEGERTSNRRTGFGLTMKLKMEESTVVRKGANMMRASEGSRVKKRLLTLRREEKSLMRKPRKANRFDPKVPAKLRRTLT